MPRKPLVPSLSFDEYHATLCRETLESFQQIIDTTGTKAAADVDIGESSWTAVRREWEALVRRNYLGALPPGSTAPPPARRKPPAKPARAAKDLHAWRGLTIARSFMPPHSSWARVPPAQLPAALLPGRTPPAAADTVVHRFWTVPKRAATPRGRAKFPSVTPEGARAVSNQLVGSRRRRCEAPDVLPHGGRPQAFAANYHKYREAAEPPSKVQAVIPIEYSSVDEQLRADLLEALRGSAAACRVYGVGLTIRRVRLTDADVVALMFPEGPPRRPRCVVLRSTLGGGYLEHAAGAAGCYAAVIEKAELTSRQGDLPPCGLVPT
ncbi:hypothetical protein DIPPA_12387 [Diplonema papillatum]|nr:hypothetical protein DIPPA_12387 [Diplonema papillatum]